ncbi:hypothetical protein AMELA_G00234960 [Ameiurus melas]|uniref:Uncharacterized protein n=1 Tax=Ameiurus melas TaxID=219545 RepID=A0A7J5ZXZ9_AMEME|nr:hypothetical protein AMELA_G00234960 [Ameiurus melas]
MLINNRFFFEDAAHHHVSAAARLSAHDSRSSWECYSDRVEYLGDEHRHFSLRLSDVKKSDEHEYCIRIRGSTDSYLFYPGMRLRVTELRVDSPEEIRSEDSGEYKCKCSNEVGYQYSVNVTLNLVDGRSKVLNAVIPVIMCLSGLSLVLIIVLLRRKKMFCWSEQRTVKHDSVAAQSAASDAPQSDSHSANQDEVHYASIAHPQKAERSAVRASEQALYASVQYTSVHFSSSHRPYNETTESNSAIYSNIK